MQLGVPVTPAGPHGHAPCEVHCEFRFKPGWWLSSGLSLTALPQCPRAHPLSGCALTAWLHRGFPTGPLKMYKTGEPSFT